MNTRKFMITVKRMLKTGIRAVKQKNHNKPKKRKRKQKELPNFIKADGFKRNLLHKLNERKSKEDRKQLQGQTLMGQLKKRRHLLQREERRAISIKRNNKIWKK